MTQNPSSTSSSKIKFNPRPPLAPITPSPLFAGNNAPASHMNGGGMREMYKSIGALEEQLKKFNMAHLKQQQQQQQQQMGTGNVSAVGLEGLQSTLNAAPNTAHAFSSKAMNDTLMQKLDPAIQQKIGALVSVVTQAGKAASDIKYQFAHILDADETQEYWFRRRIQHQWNLALTAQYKLQITTVKSADAGSKHPCFNVVIRGEEDQVIAAGTELNTANSVSSKQLVLYRNGVLSKLPVNDWTPVAMYTHAKNLYIILNTASGETSKVGLVRIKEGTQIDSDYGTRAIEGLFEKGLQAVDMTEIGKDQLLLVRGVNAKEETGHGLAWINSETGLVNRWTALDNLPPYSILQQFGTQDHAETLQLLGTVRELRSSDPLAPTQSLEVKMKWDTQKLDIDIRPEWRADQFIKTVQVSEAVRFGTWKTQTNTQSAPQLLVSHDRARWDRGILTLPDTLKIQKVIFNRNKSQLIAVGANTNSEYVIVRIPMS